MYICIGKGGEGWCAVPLLSEVQMQGFLELEHIWIALGELTQSILGGEDHLRLLFGILLSEREAKGSIAKACAEEGL